MCMVRTYHGHGNYVVCGVGMVGWGSGGVGWVGVNGLDGQGGLW